MFGLSDILSSSTPISSRRENSSSKSSKASSYFSGLYFL